MNRDNILRMAREAGFYLYDLTETHGIKTVESDDADQWAQMERFAALVRAAALEEAAKVCESAAEAFEVFQEPQKARVCATCAADIRALLTKEPSNV